MKADLHALVIPLFGVLPPNLLSRLHAFQQGGSALILVFNQPQGAPVPDDLVSLFSSEPSPAVELVLNHNRGGVAGGFNRGIERAIAIGAYWITLLDQDSDLQPSALQRLREPWRDQPSERMVVGPRIWDGRRHRWQDHQRAISMTAWYPTRLLISSGTTFRAIDWPLLGRMQEWLVVDFVDHAWSFQVQTRGFQLLQHPQVVLQQQFGAPHPNLLCRLLGMELYPPSRHFYALRNLRWLLRRAEVPMDLKLKELAKMLIKPWLWLMMEPNRFANGIAILKAIRAPLPKAKTQ
jgi:hypothetical protein